MPGESRQGKSLLVQGGDNICPMPINSTSLISLFCESVELLNVFTPGC